MRILIAGITYAPARNGQAVFTANLAEGLARLGHTVKVIFDSYEGKPFKRMLNGVEIEGLPTLDLTWFDPLAHVTLLPFRDVQRSFNEFKPDIVHIQDHYPVSRAALRLAREQGIRVLGSNHFMPENIAQIAPSLAAAGPVFKRVMWLWMLDVFKRVDAATAQSKAAAELTRAQGLNVPLTTISCGIDLKRFHPIPNIDRRKYLTRYGLNPDKKVFLFIGRVDTEKRIDVLLQAMRMVQRDDIQLGISGRGHALPYLRQLKETLQLGERVVFTDFIPSEDLPALLNSADVFSMPSEAELLSIATLEALACAKPVLLADAVALPEWVRPGLNGYLFKPGDAQDAARQMELLAEQADRWPGMGQASLEIARGHGLEDIVRKFVTLYETLPAVRPVTQVSGSMVTRAVKPR